MAVYTQAMTCSRQPVYIAMAGFFVENKMGKERNQGYWSLERLKSDWMASMSLRSLNETSYTEFPILHLCRSDIKQD